MAPKSVTETSRIIHVSIEINYFLESWDPNPQRSWMKNSWCGTASMTSQTSVLLWSDVDARCVAWSLHCLSASAALPTTLVAWLVLFTSATTVLPITLVACLLLLCPAILTEEKKMKSQKYQRWQHIYMYQPNMTHFFKIWKSPLCGVLKGLEKVVSKQRPYMILKKKFPLQKNA